MSSIQQMIHQHFMQMDSVYARRPVVPVTESSVNSFVQGLIQRPRQETVRSFERLVQALDRIESDQQQEAAAADDLDLDQALVRQLKEACEQLKATSPGEPLAHPGEVNGDLQAACAGFDGPQTIQQLGSLRSSAMTPTSLDEQTALSQMLDAWVDQAPPDFREGRAWVKDKLWQAFINKKPSIDLHGGPEVPSIDELPDCFQYFSFLTNFNCSVQRLTTLPDSLGRCTQLTSLNCENNELTSLSSLEYCTQLTHLACRGNRLTSLPSLEYCPQLTYLDCRGNRLTSLPSLEYCTQLTYLDCGFNELISLPSLENCTQLTDLNCEDNLLTSLPSLENCTQLKHLSCQENQLTSLPNLEPCTQLTYLNCENNQLTSLPNGLCNRIPGRNVFCAHNPFNAAPLLQLQTADIQDVADPDIFQRLNFDLFPSQSLLAIINQWKKAASLSEDVEFCPALLAENSELLRRFLIKLQGTADAKHEATRPIVAERICKFLAHAEVDEDFRKVALGVIEDALAACDDRVDLALSQIECQLKISEAHLMDSPVELAKLAVGLERLKQLQILAGKKIKEMRERSVLAVDETKVHLAYQLELKEKLALPIDGQKMLYRNSVTISSKDLDQVKTAVLAATQAPEEQLPPILVAFEPWQNYLQSQNRTSYEAIDEELTAKLEAAERGTSGEYSTHA